MLTCDLEARAGDVGAMVLCMSDMRGRRCPSGYVAASVSSHLSMMCICRMASRGQTRSIYINFGRWNEHERTRPEQDGAVAL